MDAAYSAPWSRSTGTDLVSNVPLLFKVTTIIPATFSLCPIFVVRGSSNCSVSWKIFTPHVSSLKKKSLLFMFYSVLFKTKWYWEEHRTFVLGNRKMFLSQQKKRKTERENKKRSSRAEWEKIGANKHSDENNCICRWYVMRTIVQWVRIWRYCSV